MTKCQRSRWQHSHGVVVVIDYADTMLSLLLLTIRGHGDSVSVYVVVDFTQTQIHR